MSEADTTLHLQCGDASAGIAVLGGGIRFLRFGARDIIPLDTPRARSHWSSGATLAPWPNRLRAGRWEYEGSTLTFPATEASGNASHGLVHDHVFDVVTQSAESVTLRTHLGDDAGYPFASEIVLTYVLSATQLSVEISAHNASMQRIPVALGAHPYFPWVEGCTLRLDADVFCEVDDILIPTERRLSAQTLGVLPHAETPIDDVALDHCFTELKRGIDALARTTITYPDGAQTTVWQDASMPYVQVFTTTLERLWVHDTSHAIAIEPQTAAANAFNSGVDLVWLEPGDTCLSRWGVAWNTVTP